MDGRGMVKIGTISDLTCFSFYATKNITSAEGGMITTEDDALAHKIAVASLHGMDSDAWKRYDRDGSWFYEIHDVGFKYNLSDVHAAIGLAQLKKADHLLARRAAIARAYNRPSAARGVANALQRQGNRPRLAYLRAAPPPRVLQSGAGSSSSCCASAA